MKLYSVSVTNTGKVRDKNEDRFLEMPKQGLFAVADGMGGMNFGEVAAEAAIESVHDYITRHWEVVDTYKREKSDESREAVLNMLDMAMQYANIVVIENAKEEKLSTPMGTTLTLFLIVDNTGFLVHAGDSRFYLFRKEEMTQLSIDHTLHEEYIQKYGDVIPGIDEKLANMLTRAIGIQDFVEVEKISFDIMASDRFMLCTDGAYSYFNGDVSDSILKRLGTNGIPDANEKRYINNLATEMENMILDTESNDNFTYIIVGVRGSTDERSVSQDLHKKMEILRRVNLFSALSFPELLKVFERGELRTYKEYDIIQTNRVSGDRELLVILEGQVSVARMEKTVMTLGVGEPVGELSFITDAERNITTFVDKESTFFVIKRSALNHLVAQYPAIGVKLLWQMSLRLSEKLKISLDHLEA